jgi:hypothetical protein
MGAPHYSREELLAILEIERLFGPLTYQKPRDVEQLFYDLTGRWRASGCIYMAYWRIKKGMYESLLEGVAV